MNSNGLPSLSRTSRPIARYHATVAVCDIGSET